MTIDIRNYFPVGEHLRRVHIVTDLDDNPVVTELNRMQILLDEKQAVFSQVQGQLSYEEDQTLVRRLNKLRLYDQYSGIYLQSYSMPDPENPAIEPYSDEHISALDLTALIQLGRQTNMARIVEQVRGQTSTVPGRIREKAHEYLDLKLQRAAPLHMYGIGGITLYDFHKHTKQDRHKDEAMMDFLTHSYMSHILINKQQLPVPIEVDEDLELQYPTLMNGIYHVIGSTTKAALTTDPRVLDWYKQKRRTHSDKDTVARESVETAHDMMVTAQRLRNEGIRALFNPQSDKFSHMRSLTEEYLGHSEIARHGILKYLRDTPVDTFENYKKARLLSSDPVYGDFYTQLADSIIEDCNVYPQEGILTSEDLTLSTSDGKHERETDIAALTDSITAKFHELIRTTNAYSLGGEALREKVDWGVLSPTSNIDISIDTSQRPPIRLHLIYRNDETREEMKVSMVFDPRTKQYDWSLLELPEEATVHAISKSFIGILSDALATIEVAAPIKQSSSQQKQSTKKQSGRITDERYDLKRQKNRWLPHIAVPTQQREEMATTEKVSGTKFSIDLSDDIFEEISRKFKNSEIRDRIVQGIEEFNNRHPGDLRNLESLTDSPYMRLRINVPGIASGVRVLLSLEGDVFKIVDIDRRSNVYKRKNLQ